MRIRTQLVGGFGLLLVLMVGVAVVADREVRLINATMSEITDINAVKQRQAINFRGSVHDRAIAFRDLVLLDDEDQLQRTLTQIQQLTAMYDEAARELDGIFTASSGHPEERALLEAIKAVEQKTLPMLASILAGYDAGSLSAASMVLTRDASPAFSEWLAAINRFIDWQERKSQLETRKVRSVADSFTVLMVAFCLIGLLIGITVAYLITRYLLRSLGGEPAEVAEVVHLIADGNLHVKMQTDYDESISAAVIDMQTKLREMVMQIATASADINSQIDHLGVSSRQVLVSAQDQAALASASAQSLERMSQSIEEVSLITRHTEENSEKATQLAASGVELVQAVASEMDLVARTVADSSERVGALQRRSEEISGIAGAIRSIADQTNLLALNAAIEAARAGDSGRGFAVVADEVRQLAQRTTSATEEIAEMIVQIQNETRDAVAAMQTTGPQVSHGLELTNQAAERLEDIRNQSNDSLSNVRDIVRVTEQQVAAITEITSHVERISRMSHETSAATQGNARATETLDRTTKGLEAEIHRFQID
ncbi:methyl-accepting chemotaxis protein [Stutzerimonas stutzeri]